MDRLAYRSLAQEADSRVEPGNPKVYCYRQDGDLSPVTVHQNLRKAPHLDAQSRSSREQYSWGRHIGYEHNRKHLRAVKHTGSQSRRGVETGGTGDSWEADPEPQKESCLALLYQEEGQCEDGQGP